MDELFKTSVAKLEEMTKKHEESIVIDLAVDRIIKYVGAYAVGILAVATIVFAVIGPVLTCDPTNKCNNPAKAAFTDSFCLGSNSSVNKKCEEIRPINHTKFVLRHENVKPLYQYLPYILIGEAVLFVLPWTYWHFKMGSRLTGQIKYMKSFLKEMHDLLKGVTEARYNGKPFDENSNSFNVRETYLAKNNRRNTMANYSETQDQSVAAENGNFLQTKNKQKRNKKIAVWHRFLCGNMRDRHLFSIFCYENFASMEHLPYLLSVFEASKNDDENLEKEPGTNMYNINTCILYQWCHARNFSGVRLVTVYLAKHLFTALQALVILVLLLWWHWSVLSEAESNSSSLYMCYLPHENQCVICTINRKREMFFFFWLNFALVSVVFLFSVYQWIIIRRSKNLAMSHYFEKIKRSCKTTIDLKNIKRGR